MHYKVSDENEVSPGELFRLIRVHQEITQTLLSRLEKLCHSPSDPESADEPVRTEWNFTDRERHVAELLAKGLTNRQIARTLGISERTVKNHLHAIFHKLAVGDRTHAVIKLLRGT
ncbi:response regulator transcription factor [Amycolatopsis sp. NPDC051716]|uniref:response regulator transcription factor n=1 Tax=Amycolatopsis sp. NPDC051716 TaxID=3155804 RepID=UPI00343206AE